jgi:quinol-cytochrome oxidoreductase complex cytochrome b subunit
MKNFDQVFWIVMMIVIGIWAAVTPGRQIKSWIPDDRFPPFVFILALVYLAYLFMK